MDNNTKNVEKKYDENSLYFLCKVMEVNYIKSHGYEMSDDFTEKLFPRQWFLVNDFKVKIEVLTEALEKRLLIEKTNAYQNFLSDYKLVLPEIEVL